MTRTDKRDALLLILESFIVFTVMQLLMFNTSLVLASWSLHFAAIVALRALFFAASGVLAILGFTNGVKKAKTYRLTLAILLAMPAIFELILLLVA